MPKVAELGQLPAAATAVSLPVSVIVPARNEGRNLARCLESLRGVGEVYVIDSQSSDHTVDIAQSFAAKVVQFHYRGGWPKKRQWAMDTLPLAYDWIFLIDADEALTPELTEEVRQAIQDPGFDGYYVALRMFFLGRALRHGDASFYKLSLFRRGKGRFECRLREQDTSMCDMEVHEHVMVDGRTARLKNPMLHHNVDTLSRYIQKHDEYSNWEARVWMLGEASLGQLPPALFATQAQRRRWLRKMFFSIPGSPVLFFLYKYLLRLGFLDGMPGLIYCGLQGVQFFHIKAKIYELRAQKAPTIIAVAIPVVSFGLPILETTLSVVRRLISGRPVFTADREHIHHKLLQLGLSHRQVVIVLYAVSAIFALLSLFLLWPTGSTLGLVLAVLGTGVWMGVQHLNYLEFGELRRVAHRTMEQRQIFINNLAIRRATEELKVTSNYDQICRILVAAFSNNDFDAFDVRLLRIPDELPESHGLQVITGAEPHLSWKRPGGHLASEMVSAWTLTLDLVAANNRRRGSMIIYRSYSERDLQLDVNLLTSIFPVALADALERAFGQAVVVVPAAHGETGLMEAQAG